MNLGSIFAGRASGFEIGLRAFGGSLRTKVAPSSVSFLSGSGSGSSSELSSESDTITRRAVAGRPGVFSLFNLKRTVNEIQ